MIVIQDLTTEFGPDGILHAKVKLASPNNGTFTLADAAKHLGVSESRLIEIIVPESIVDDKLREWVKQLQSVTSETPAETEKTPDQK